MLEQLLQHLWCVEKTIQEHIFSECSSQLNTFSHLVVTYLVQFQRMYKGVQNNPNNKRYVCHFQSITKPTASELEKELFNFVSFSYHPTSRSVM